MADVITIGSGSISGTDRIEPGGPLADSGLVGYMGFDCLAERTLAMAQVRRLADPDAGFDERLPRIIDLLSSYIGGGGRVAGNFGQANPEGAARRVLACLREHGLAGTKVGVITGDDVLDVVVERNLELPERACKVGDLGSSVISAHAYVGAETVVEAFDRGAQFVLGGRLADPSVWVGAICHELGWALDDWDRVAAATLVGHMLEGGIGRRPGKDLSLPVGYPLAEVTDDHIEFAKLPGTGGPIDRKAAKLSCAHEIHDPTRYLTPDVVADLSDVDFEEVGPNRVSARGAKGAPPPDTYRVLVGLDLGWKVVGEVSFGGPRCVERARETGEIMLGMLSQYEDDIDEIRRNIHGVDAVFEGAYEGGYPADCRLRVAARVKNLPAAEAISDLLWRLYANGGGGVTRFVDRAIGVTPAFLPRDEVTMNVEVLTA